MSSVIKVSRLQMEETCLKKREQTIFNLNSAVLTAFDTFKFDNDFFYHNFGTITVNGTSYDWASNHLEFRFFEAK